MNDLATDLLTLLKGLDARVHEEWQRETDTRSSQGREDQAEFHSGKAAGLAEAFHSLDMIFKKHLGEPREYKEGQE